ncbi:MAG: polysaccharide biosynthesis/export family protein [Gemmatimonadales bacterium]
MRIRSIALMVATLIIGARVLAAQTDAATTVVNAQRSMVTRAELTSALDVIDKQLASSGYSSALRDAKRAEGDAIRDRLAEGDLHVGDLVNIDLVGDVAGLKGTYAVTPNRTISLPGGAEIPVRGVLRSEMQGYITEQLKKFVREPVVKVTTSIRISMFGAIGKPGLYSAPADLLLGDALMTPGGGPANNARFDKSQIKRGEKVVVDGPEFQAAIRQGKTLDQLNLQAGDEIIVAAKPAGGTVLRIVGAVGSLGSLIYLGTQIF